MPYKPKELDVIRNDNARLLNKMYPFKRNVIEINSNNSLEHELKKAEISYNLIKEGNEIVTEARFLNGKIADIFVLDVCWVYEVLNTEKLEDCKKKVESYPVKRVIMVKV